MKEQKFCEAVQQLKRSDILLNGPLSVIEGLVQLRTKVLDLSQVCSSHNRPPHLILGHSTKDH